MTLILTAGPSEGVGAAGPSGRVGVPGAVVNGGLRTVAKGRSERKGNEHSTLKTKLFNCYCSCINMHNNKTLTIQIG